MWGNYGRENIGWVKTTLHTYPILSHLEYSAGGPQHAFFVQLFAQPDITTLMQWPWANVTFLPPHNKRGKTAASKKAL